MSKVELFDHRPNVRVAGTRKSRLNVLPDNPDRDQGDGAVSVGRFPKWLHRRLPKGNSLKQTGAVLNGQRLHTVCEEAKCPNLLECWSKKTATFLVMGKECTRSCGFCDIDFNKSPAPLDSGEPQRVAESARELGLKHVVITMVARDDLPDDGGQHIADVIQAIRDYNSHATVEVLTSDFSGNTDALDTVLDRGPDIFNHNIETVRRLTPRVRHKATYNRTLFVLDYAKQHSSNNLVKSGIMVGLGETDTEVKATIRDLHGVGCDIITIGQYLQASRHKLRVKAFVTPEQFKAYEEYGYSIGVKAMYCGPFVRSSYNAADVIEQARAANPV